jgi:signal transduction histidine kinase
MIKKLLLNHPYRFAASVFGGLLLLFILMEGWHYAAKPAAGSNKHVSPETLDKVASAFVNRQQKLLKKSRELAHKLQSQIDRGSSRNALFKSMQSYSQLWGATLYREHNPLVWNSFSSESFQRLFPPDHSDIHVKVTKINNVLVWVAHVSFKIRTAKGAVPYHLYTARRIRQTNALPIGANKTFKLLNDIIPSQSSAVGLSFYDTPPAHANYRILRTLSHDSVGVVYAKPKKLPVVITQWEQTTRFWRGVFILFCTIVIAALFYLWVDEFPVWRGLFFQLLILAAGWFIFNRIDIAGNLLPRFLKSYHTAQIASYQMLCTYMVDGIFCWFGAFTLNRKLSGRSFYLHSNWFFRTIFTAIAGGLLNAAAIVFTLTICYYLTYATTIPLLTLQIFPHVAALFFYFCLGILFLALTITLTAVNRFLLRSCDVHFRLTVILYAFSFIAGLFIAQFYILEHHTFSWIFFLSLVYFALIFGLSVIYNRLPHRIPASSPLRKAALYSFIIAIAGTTIIYQARTAHLDPGLSKTVQAYTQKKDVKARNLTREILARLHQKFHSLADSTLQNHISSIKTQFAKTIQSAIKNDNGLYSFDIRLINAADSVLADYSTNFNSPNWARTFNPSRLEMVMAIQQIDENNVRPVIQQPHVQNADSYQTFYRGWVPLYGTGHTTPIAWILCSVYRIRPNFNKPMRAVIASQNYQEWRSSYFIQMYKNNRLHKKLYRGIRAHYPVYNVLSKNIQQALQQDSTLFYTDKDSHHAYRNLVIQQPKSRVIKCSTIIPGFQNILYSFFRLSFVLLITGFILLVIFQWLKSGNFFLFSPDEQFRYRILDSFLLATLIFLILLVFVTHFAIKRQNKNLVKEQLFNKLQSITASIKKNPTVRRELDRGNPILLNSLTTPLNVDASLYNDRLWQESTTPQIYQQHLLPDAMPYPVYSDLFLDQKRSSITHVTLGGQELLIGYRTILSNDGKALAAIAIPTFVQSPKFNQQLLQTTSYLIILYLIVFGLFIIATTVISRQLTRPLVYIQEGLNKISKGNLDTTLPATRNDEIGSLAIAYNQMVGRLKELQKELAEFEREEAWKEMAQQVAHEIKNPLTPMKLNIQHLERQLSSGNYTVKELKQKIKVITQNLTDQIQSLSNIASDFSKFSQPIEQEDFTAVDIDTLLHSAADLYLNDDKMTISITSNGSTDVVYGVKDELRRVFINLIKNAREAITANGVINLKTYRRAESVFIEIEDNGQGIREENKAKIFVPNFSTKSSGTGLGLAICKKVIEAHEGSISFASIEGEGSTFVIKLPLLKDGNEG